MIFIWGKKLVLGKLGYVADFCPICRDVQACELVQVRKVSHFYYIPLGSGEALGHQTRCRACQTTLWVKGEDFASVSQDGGAPLPALYATLGPQAAQAAQDRKKLEVRVLAGGLSPEERTLLIEEPFSILDARLENRGAATKLDRKSGMVLGGTFAAVIVLGSAISRVPEAVADAMGWLLILAIIGGLGATVYFVATDVRRYYAGEIEPLLAKTLAPLAPTKDELERVKAKMTQLGKAMGKRLDPLRLLTRIAALRGGAAVTV